MGKQKVVIKVPMNEQKSRSKAMKIAVGVPAALALINIRFQAMGNSSTSATLLSSFLVTMVAAASVFAFTSTLIGLMLEGVHQAVATICIYAGLIWVVLGLFFMLATFVPERFVWLVWGSGGVLVVVLFPCQKYV
ncbi:hypothetical protein RHMOL_Rhmol06G0251100 [Rhododendron molle]|uniref:Uncharacterized protein n=1 Tax=Rhododendron molle TaxID=49168 RepID=A0ACC0NGV7_RHOML|nr:hypothetical protein RHMOL_Rhmol06G0251100 [Rhododendron molle]